MTMNWPCVDPLTEDNNRNRKLRLLYIDRQANGIGHLIKQHVSLGDRDRMHIDKQALSTKILQ